MPFKLRDCIGLINYTHFLQSERRVQYFDSFVCSGVIKVKINSLIYSLFSAFFPILTPLSFQVRNQFNLHLSNRAKTNSCMITSLIINLKY